MRRDGSAPRFFCHVIFEHSFAIVTIVVTAGVPFPQVPPLLRWGRSRQVPSGVTVHHTEAKPGALLM